MSWIEPRWPRRLPDPFVVGLATLGPVGRWGPAPGTLGTVAGLVFFILLLRWLPAAPLALWSVATAWLAVALCGEAERRLGKKDPGCVILDEFVAVPLCFLGWARLAAIVPAGVVFLLGFGLFRFFDIRKPAGINALQQLPGGWGVVADDLGAALATCVALHIGIGAYGLFF